MTASQDQTATVQVAQTLSRSPRRFDGGGGSDDPGGAPPIDDGRELPEQVGRYKVLRKLGQGGMGRVYLAYDPELDRSVAVKVMMRHPLRLRREAQAMAKLNHPNVATVFEVGWDDRTAFVAMEHIEGETLRSWIREAKPPRALRDMLDVFMQAGRGLAAAHARGLVHRDFKPENVMVAADGAVKVLDFGLAVSPEDDEAGTRVTDRHRSLLAGPMTETGMILGTPAYMAPEHHRGEPVDAKSDQFAFCIALYEALWGTRPFSGETIEELARHVVAGRRVAEPRPAGVPPWVERVIDRGLAVQAADRWPDMDALLDALAKGAAVRRTRAMTGALVIGAIAIGGAAVGLRVEAARVVAACDDESTALHAVWNDDAKAAVHRGLTGASVSHAETTYERIAPVVDDWSARWAEARRQTCQRTDIDATWSAEIGASARQCLDRHGWALEELIEGLSADPDAAAVHRALPAAMMLPNLDGCQDEAELLGRPEPPADPDVRAQLDMLRRTMATVDRLEDMARPQEALATARTVLDDARALGHDPFTASVYYVVARLCDATGALEEAEQSYEAALDLAVRSGPDDLIGAIMTELSMNVGFSQARLDAGRRWGRMAEAWLVRQGRNDGLERADLLNNLSMLSRAAGDLPGAQRLTAESLALREAALGEDHPVLAVSLTNLATLHGMQGDLAAAEPLAERAVAIMQRALGPEHPDLASALVVLGNLEHLQGRNDHAIARFERAQALYEAALGPAHPAVGDAMTNIAIAHVAMGRDDLAEPLFEHALQIRRDAYGPEHPEVVDAQENLDKLRARPAAPHMQAKPAIGEP